MPLKQIEQEIEAKAAAELEAIRRDGEARAKEIADRSRAELKELAEADLLTTERILSGTKKEMAASAEIEAGKLLLSAREAAVSEECRRIRSMLVKELSRPAAVKPLIRMAARELKRFSDIGISAEVVAGPAYLAQAKAALPKASVAKGAANGIIVRSTDGKISIVMTAEGIADSLSEEIRLAAMSHLHAPARATHTPKESGRRKGPKAAKAAARKAAKKRNA